MSNHDEDETIKPSFTVRRDHDESECSHSETMKAVGEKAEAIKDAIVEKAGAIKDAVVEKAEAIKDAVVEKAHELKDKVASKMHSDPEPEEK